MGRFHVDTPTLHKEVNSPEEAWKLALDLWAEGHGETVEVNDTKLTQPQPEAPPRKKEKR